MKLNGKLVVVTGAASGIGLATAQAFAEKGAYVFLGDINVGAGKEAADNLKSTGRASEFIKLDVTDENSIAEFSKAVGQHGPLDILVNCAGWSRVERFIDTSPDLWRRLIDLNYVGPLRITHTFLQQMIDRKSGKIVNVASDAGRVGSGGEAVYSGAKGGVVAFTKALAREMARFSINVNCVCPGPTDTPLLESIPETQRAALVKAIPFRRFGKPSEVADAILFFASARADYVTGQVLSVSGGLTMVD